MLDLPPLKPLCERILAAIEAAPEGVTVREMVREEGAHSFDNVWHAFDRLSTRGYIRSQGYRGVSPKATIDGVQDYASQEPVYILKESPCT